MSLGWLPVLSVFSDILMDLSCSVCFNYNLNPASAFDLFVLDSPELNLSNYLALPPLIGGVGFLKSFRPLLLNDS